MWLGKGMQTIVGVVLFGREVALLLSLAAPLSFVIIRVWTHAAAILAP